MQKETIKRLTLFLMVSLMLTGSVFHVSKQNVDAKEAGTDSAYGKIWSAPNTLKIKQNDINYKAKGEAALSYQGVRNEYENAQLLITATKDISRFELKTADLTCGNHVLSNTNFTVYVQKYTSVSDTYGRLQMPDALLPMEAAGQYQENTISANKNGALWVTVYIPKGTMAGTYEGKFQLILDGAAGETIVEIPVSVRVYDYTLPDEPTAKSLFSWRCDEVAVGELDGSIRMMEAYYEFFKDYRISLQSLPIETLLGDEYVNAITKYWDELSTYTILETQGQVGSSLHSKEKKVTEQILAVAKASTPERNLFEKAMIYFIDEPDIREESTRRSVLTKMNIVSEILQGCVEIIDADTTGQYSDFKEIPNWKESITGIPNVVTLVEYAVDWLIQNQDTAQGKELLSAMNCICVKFSDDATMQKLVTLTESRAIELWWYTCNYPIAPYGNFDIGDDNLLSARSFSWYQSKYDVAGLLYWSASGYTGATDGEFLDIYANPNRYYNNSSAPAGDGFLTYPGEPYGVYGPLPSMRLMSIRDGMEEYELLNAAKENPDAASYEAFMREVYSSLGEDTSNLYQDGEDGLDFTALRTKLLQEVSTLEDPLALQADNEAASEDVQTMTEDFIVNVVNAADSAQRSAVQGEADTELLLSFDSYQEIAGAGLMLKNQFGETDVNKDLQFVSEGAGSWLVKPQGDYGVKGIYPYFRLRCMNTPRVTTFRKSDFSTYDKIMLDIYNASDEEIRVEWNFVIQNVFGSYASSEKRSYTLQAHAWTTCEYDLTGEEYRTALDLTMVKYMNFTILSKKESKEDTVPELYLDNLRGHLADETLVRKDFEVDLSERVSFETAEECYLLADDGIGNNAMQLSRVRYADCGIVPKNASFGEYVLRSELRDTVWPAFTLYYNGQQPKGKVVSFMLYVSADESVTEDKYYYVQCGNSRLIEEKCKLNQWIHVEAELTSEATSSWFFLNFDDGTGCSKFRENAVTVYLDNFIISDEVKAGYYYEDISGYRTGQYAAPQTDATKVFAGWYEDPEWSIPLGKEVMTGGAYAKFVDAAVLSAKCQIAVGTKYASEYTNLRMVTTVDSLNYSAVGFGIKINGKAVTRTTDTVYETIRGYANGEGITYQPTFFSQASKYFMAYTITNIPNGFFGTDIVITPMWITLDGTTVTGESKTVAIEDAILDFSHGVTFEKPAEKYLFSKNNVDYTFEEFDGSTALKFDSTGVKWPYIKADFDETYTGAATRLCFRIYVKADETLVKDQGFYVGSDDGTRHPFNQWTEGWMKVEDGAADKQIFLNFDAAISAIGAATPITVYLDDFYVTTGEAEKGITFENPAEKYVFWKGNAAYSFEEFDGTTAMKMAVAQNWPNFYMALQQPYTEAKTLHFRVYAKVDESLVTNEVFYVGNQDPAKHKFNCWTDTYVTIPANKGFVNPFLNFEAALKTIDSGNITVYLDDFTITE